MEGATPEGLGDGVLDSPHTTLKNFLIARKTPVTRPPHFYFNMRLYLGNGNRGIFTMEDEYKFVRALSNSATFEDPE